MLKLTPAILALALLAPATARAEPPVWVIRDRDSTITLFGSVHILPRGVDWRPAPLTQALKTADDVWFEIPLDDASRLSASQAATAKAMLPDGVSLSSLLDAPTRAKLARVGTSLNLPVAYLDRLRPWMADLALSQAFMDKQGANASQGVEEVLYAEVKDKATLRAFETAAQQLAIYADSPQADQIAVLADTLHSIEDDPQSFQTIVGLWAKSDIAGLSREAVDSLKTVSPGMYQALVTRRNTDWVKQIKTRLAGKGETLMVVGVGHLVGPDSVPAMLRKEGIKVEGP